MQEFCFLLCLPVSVLRCHVFLVPVGLLTERWHDVCHTSPFVLHLAMADSHFISSNAVHGQHLLVFCTSDHTTFHRSCSIKDPSGSSAFIRCPVPPAFDGEGKRRGLVLFASLERDRCCESCVTVERGTQNRALWPRPRWPSYQRQRYFHLCRTCQQKVNGKMKGIQKEILSDSFTFIRVTEGEKTAMRGVLLWGFLSNFNLLLVTLYLSLSSQLSLSFCLLVPPVCLCLCLSVCLHGCQLAALTTHHLSLNLQPCHRLLSPPTMWTSTLRRQPTTRSTAASRGPRSSWRSGTATAWRGWVIGPSWGPRPPNEGGNMSNLCC